MRHHVMGRYNNFFANLVRVFHGFLTIAVAFGWLIENRAWLCFLMIFIPALIVHWRTNNNQCVLTIAEERLRRGVAPTPNEASKTFVGRILKSVFGIDPTMIQVSMISYSLAIFSWACSCYRLYNL